ncbi:phage virion morphogenesis protein [Thalassobaculum sp. OXR-137]|uniref:phage virion morphogenesis protein n=1 Tax=Thalassobaculum sp. OXR-137 TaxID=3100173 RepID=UPI002AC9E1CA|nr:phage virion morphogenesis protein [Thalassobaculum sp. OXR-137]WPZ33223.1 phage virion morphogenesis protein [Thalassobaculum sp. OXR-137]WPZ34884.1 phage virion morphogenesis protein [Thalassobaculum sp. OXR-137]
MAGFSASLSIDEVRAATVLSQWADGGQDLTELLDPIGAALRDNVLDRFETGKGPDGTAWPKSRRASQEGGQTLVDSARLRNSMTYEASAGEVMVGTNVIYAAIHQFGGVIRAKTEKGLSFTVPGFAAEGGQEGFVNVQSVTMPPRPFVGFGPEDEASVIDMFEAWLFTPIAMAAGGAA